MENPTKQFIRFAIVGFMNTGLDFLVLNSLIFIFGIGQRDFKFIIFKVISFMFAVANSFIFNKVWVFKNKEKGRRLSKQVGSFLIVSVIGLIINASISYVFFRMGSSALPGIDARNMANGAAVAGTLAVLISNFFGYKFFVFKNLKNKNSAEAGAAQEAKEARSSYRMELSKKRQSAFRSKAIKIVRPRIASF